MKAVGTQLAHCSHSEDLSRGAEREGGSKKHRPRQK